MLLVKNGARVGAAAFVVGLSLVGSSSMGVADADTGSSGSSSESSGQADVTARAVGRAKAGPLRGLPSARMEGRDRSPMSVSVPVSASAVKARAAVEVDDLRVVAAQGRSRVVSPGPGLSVARISSSMDLVAESEAVVKPVDVGVVSVLTAVAPAGRGVSAAAAVPTGFVAAVDVTVTNIFEALSSWISHLPNGPLTEVLEGGLLLVRRALFNHAPVAESVGSVMLPTGTVIGKIDAFDPEDDAITFKVIQNPLHGNVAISQDGTYSYAPTQTFTGSDTFVVAVDNPGTTFNILNPTAGPTLVPITISGTFKAPPVQGGNFDGNNKITLYNYTSRTLEYKGNVYPDDFREPTESGMPSIGYHFKPGESLIIDPSSDGIYWAKFEAIDDPFGVGSVGRFIMNFTATSYWSREGDPQIEYSNTWTGEGDVFEVDPLIYTNNRNFYFLDPQNSKVESGNWSAELKEQIIQRACAQADKCTFIPPDDRSRFRDDDFEHSYRAVTDTFPIVVNVNGIEDVVFSRSVSRTIQQSLDLELSNSVTATFLSMVSKSITDLSSYSWDLSATFDVNVTTYVPPNYALRLEYEEPIVSTVGDVIARYGNTTYHLHDVRVDAPDASRALIIRFITEPVPPAALTE
jgi:hypothetical protein